MTQQVKANPKWRVQRGVLAFALVGLLIVCASQNLDSTPPLSISISDVQYEKTDPWQEPLLRAKFALTNNGPSPLHLFYMAEYVRIETTNGWVTNEFGSFRKIYDSVIPIPDTRFRLLGVGEGCPSEATFPETARRWQAGYEVVVLSPRKNLQTKFGPKIAKPIVSLFGDWISDYDATTVVWGPVIEITNTAKHAGLPLQQHPDYASPR